MNLHIAPEHQRRFEFPHVVFVVEEHLVSFIGDHVEIVIAQLYILSATADVQVFMNLFVRSSNI